jgi:hypothetical protein
MEFSLEKQKEAVTELENQTAHASAQRTDGGVLSAGFLASPEHRCKKQADAYQKLSL